MTTMTDSTAAATTTTTTANSNIAILVDKQVTYFPYDCKWVPSSNRFVSVGGFSRGAGIIQVYATTDGVTSMKLLTEAEKPNPIKCATFTGTGGSSSSSSSSSSARHVATGDFEGGLSIWDPEDLSVPLYSVRDAHRGTIINAIASCAEAPGAPEIATGGHDGRACVWDPRLSTGPVAEVVSKSPDCWCVALGPYGTDRALCAGFSDGRVLVYDLRCSAKALYERQTGAGVYGLSVSGRTERVYTADAAGSVSVYDCGNGFDVVSAKYESTAGKRRKAAATVAWFAKPVPGSSSGSRFAAGMGSGALALWDIDCGKKKEIRMVGERNLSLKKKAFPVIALDFSEYTTHDSAIAVTSVLDSTIKIIKINNNNN